MEARNRVWENRETETMEECGGGGEAIRGAVMGSRVPFWEAAVGFFCRRARLFKRSQTPMRVETANPLGNQDPGSRQAPWEDPPFPSAEN